MRLITLSTFLIFLAFSLSADPPDWQVNASGFSQSKNLSAQLYLNDVLDNNTDNIIAAFVNGEVRGVASGISVGAEVYYFMTVYSSNPSTDTVSFKVYLPGEDDIFDIEEKFLFNDINPSTIYELNSYLNIDQPISLLPIEDQTQVEGFEFDSIYLPDFLIQVDNDPIVWTYSGDNNLQVNISESWLIVTNPSSPSWTGMETLTITATEQTINAYTASTTIDYTVLTDYGAPEWGTVSGQKIGLNQTFRTFDLDESRFPYPGSTLAYHYFMPQATGTDPNENWSFSAKNFQYSMNVTTKVRYGSTDHENTVDRLLAFISGQLVGIAAPKNINGEIIYFLTVYSDNNNVDVNFQLYDSEHQQLYDLPNEINFLNGAENGTPDNPLVFNTAPLEVIIAAEGSVLINRVQAGWIGTQTVAFIAYDTLQPLINADTTFADFTVVNEYAPEIAGITDQYVEQGSAFPVIDLKDYYNEFDGDDVIFSVLDANDLGFSINSKGILSTTILDPNWTGTDEVKIRISDDTPCGLYNEQTVNFTVGAPNQAPEILTIPDQIIGIGDTFPKLNLNDYLNEPNGDAVSWTYFHKAQNLEMADPAWSINPGSFQFSMTMTAQVSVRAGGSNLSGHQLAAFHEGELRGIATASEIAGDWYYFLNIYSNQSQDSIYFEYYDPDQNAVFAIDDSVRFVSQQQIGTLASPFVCNAGFINPQADNNELCPEIIDKDWLGSDTLFVIATELGTFERYRDTMPLIFRVQVESPILPVDLISFNGRAVDDQSILNWQIANPDNLLAFEIQRAISKNQNGNLDFNPIGTRAFELNEAFYEFTDEAPYRGKNYYRLKMIDQDGSYEYSPTVNVNFEVPNAKVNLYPNPVYNEVVYLDIKTAPLQNINLQIIDANGRIWQQLNLQSQNTQTFLSLDIHNFPAGKYFVRVKVNHLIHSTPFVILGK